MVLEVTVDVHFIGHETNADLFESLEPKVPRKSPSREREREQGVSVSLALPRSQRSCLALCCTETFIAEGQAFEPRTQQQAGVSGCPQSDGKLVNRVAGIADSDIGNIGQ